MKAMRLQDLGANQPFEPIDIEACPPGANEVAIRVHAASVNVVDTKIRGGMRDIAPDAPIILGCDAAGIVEAVGDRVQGLATGDAVYGCVGGVKGRDGAYAERMIADSRLLAPKPDRLDFREAAALPLVAITAWEALIDRLDIQPGERVLVHGGTGGVGHVGVQLAKARGAIVHATVSSEEKAEIARRLGADRTINYCNEPVADYVHQLTGGAGYNAVFDTIGGPNITRSMEALAVNGRCASIVSLETAPDLTPLHMKNASLHVVFMLIPMLTNTGLEAHGQILRRLTEMVDAGLVEPLLDRRRFGAHEIAAAHAHLSSGAATGKVVIDIAEA